MLESLAFIKENILTILIITTVIITLLAIFSTEDNQIKDAGNVVTIDAYNNMVKAE